jgi:hypothetical protein
MCHLMTAALKSHNTFAVRSQVEHNTQTDFKYGQCMAPSHERWKRLI